MIILVIIVTEKRDEEETRKTLKRMENKKDEKWTSNEARKWKKTINIDRVYFKLIIVA